jgi:hypothetical protein
MPALLLSIFRFARLLLSGHQAIAIENAALRLQLAAFQRKRKRPVLTTFDRVFWITLRRLWSGWRQPLVYVKADTVARWQQERFRRFWARLSKRHGPRRGRPVTGVETRRLIERMVVATPLWRAPRLHGELKMLSIRISERTVSRILRTLRRPPTQTWKTFLHNHIGQMVSIDFFAVPTITMRVLFVFIVLEHRRRQVLHFNVTEHPTAAWTSQQIVEAFADRVPNPFGAQQAMSLPSAGVEHRKDYSNPSGGWPASPLCTRCSVMTCVRTQFWRMTGGKRTTRSHVRALWYSVAETRFRQKMETKAKVGMPRFLGPVWCPFWRPFFGQTR